MLLMKRQRSMRPSRFFYFAVYIAIYFFLFITIFNSEIKVAKSSFTSRASGSSSSRRILFDEKSNIDEKRDFNINNNLINSNDRRTKYDSSNDNNNEVEGAALADVADIRSTLNSIINEMEIGNISSRELELELVDILDTQEYLLYKSQVLFDRSHLRYLQSLKSQGFEPKVIYDIGSNMLYFSHQAKVFWPNATYVLFDAIPQFEPLYTLHNFDYYHIGALSDTSNREVKFYFNIRNSGGSSYYREVGGLFSHLTFTDDNYMDFITSTLDEVVEEKSYLPPDLVKLDVQGAELDIIKGGLQTLGNAQILIVEMQHSQYNIGAPEINETLDFITSLNWTMDAPRYSCDHRGHNGCEFDADYGFSRPVIEPSGDSSSVSAGSSSSSSGGDSSNGSGKKQPVIAIAIDLLFFKMYKWRGMNVTDDKESLILTVDGEVFTIPKLGLLLEYQFSQDPKLLLEEFLRRHNLVINDVDKEDLLHELHVYLLKLHFVPFVHLKLENDAILVIDTRGEDSSIRMKSVRIIDHR